MKAISVFLVALMAAGTSAAQERNPVAAMEMDAGLPLHTIYTPRAAQEKLGIVVWGNGGCLNDGSNYQDLLSEVAARGFLVIANGAMNPPELTSGTSAAQLTQAIDWAIAENARPGGKLEGKLDTGQIAVMGHSCGGRQALSVSADPRVKTSVILSAGGSPPEMLAQLHAPTLYFSGGASDRAAAGVESDFERITGVPLMKVSLEVGHNGTLFEESGGAFGRVIGAWLTWRLKGSAEGAKWFVGADCMLCKVSAWTLAKKNID
jgi:hypothetical protein